VARMQSARRPSYPFMTSRSLLPFLNIPVLPLILSSLLFVRASLLPPPAIYFLPPNRQFLAASESFFLTGALSAQLTFGRLLDRPVRWAGGGSSGSCSHSLVSDWMPQNPFFLQEGTNRQLESPSVDVLGMCTEGGRTCLTDCIECMTFIDGI